MQLIMVLQIKYEEVVNQLQCTEKKVYIKEREAEDHF